MMISSEKPILDFDTAKIQYELLGDSFPKISAVLNIAVDSLERVALAEDWTRLKPTAAAYNTYLAKILNSHRAKISLTMLYRELEMFPHVAELENLLLNKLYNTANNINPFDHRAPQALRALTQAMNSITGRQDLMKQHLSNLFSEDAPPQGVQTHITMDTTTTT